MTYAPISWRRREPAEANCDTCDAPTPARDLERCEDCGAYVCEDCRVGDRCTSCAEKRLERP